MLKFLSNSFKKEFTPKTFTVIKEGYSAKTFIDDITAGLTVAIVALPLAMAFAIASGVGPERGLYTAVIAGILISLFGGSRVQIGGPTGAFVVIVLDIVNRQGYDGLAIATLMAGVILIVMGLFRFGAIIKFIPYPVITGFTSGIALIIFSTQIKDFFGLEMDSVPGEFIEKWGAYFHSLDTTNFTALAVGVCTVLVILFFKRYYPKIPGPIMAVVLGGGAAYFLNLPIETIESKFGEIPDMLPMPSFPDITVEKIKSLIPDATTIALLAAIESLLSAVVADGMTGQKHRSNCELVGQGAANIGSVLFGGIPATGAIARTVTNIKAGAKTPFAGIFHGIFVLLFMFIFATLIVKVPLATLAGILIVVAWNMSEIKHFRHLLKAPSSDVLVLLTTFFLTVLVDLNTAVQVGVVMASLLFIKRITDVTEVRERRFEIDALSGEEEIENDPDAIQNKIIPQGTEVYEINGPFFFGVADRLKDTFDTLQIKPKVFILRMRNVPMIDATGMHALDEFYESCLKKDTTLILSGVRDQLKNDLKRFGFIKKIGEKSVCPHIDVALKRAEEIVYIHGK